MRFKSYKHCLREKFTNIITIILEWSIDSLLFFTDYLFNFATTATKKITESVAETAQTIKKSVEEGKIDDIIDKVHLNIFWKYKFMKFISS